MDLSLSYFMELHDKIQITSPTKIKHTITCMNSKILKELLLVCCKYYYNPLNRQRLKKSNNQNHLNIIKTVDKLQSKHITRISSESINPFHSLPQILISYIISFLDQKNRSKMPFICYCFLKSSYQSISMTDFTIKAGFMNKTLTQNPVNFNHHKFSNCHSIAFNNCYIRSTHSKKKSENMKINAKKLFQSKSIKHVELNRIWCDLSDSILKYNILSQIEQITANMKTIPAINSTNLKSLTLESAFYSIIPTNILQSMQRFYIQNNNEMINISNGDADIKKYILSPNKSNLKYLEISGTNTMEMKCDNTQTPHPIFWLWNIPNLQTCKLNITLPKANISEKEFEKLLSISTVIQKTRNQKLFQGLTLKIETKCDCWTWNGNTRQCARTTHRNNSDNTDELLTNDLNILLKYLNKLYPNLTSIKYKIVQRYARPENYLLKLEWKPILNNIQHLNIDILSVSAAYDILTFVSQNENIKTVVLSDIGMDRLNVGGIKSWNNDYKLMLFMDKLCNLMQNVPNNLCSLCLLFGNGAYHRDLTQTYWNLYEKLLKTFLNSNNIFFNGYLQFKLPTWTNIHEWNSENKAYSLKISQLICNIQNKIQTYNSKHLNEEKKLVLNLNGLRLMKEHRNFLNFWFYNDSCLYYDKDQQFIFQSG